MYDQEEIEDLEAAAPSKVMTTGAMICGKRIKWTATTGPATATRA